MVHDDEPVGLDGLQVEFDDERVVSDAGVMLVATLARAAGDRGVGGAAGAVAPGSAGRGERGAQGDGAAATRWCWAPTASMTASVLRAGRTRRLLGGWMPAPSTLGTFLRAFTFGHVRQLDALLGRRSSGRGRRAPGPGAGRLVIDVDSFVGEVCGRLKQGAAYGYTQAARLPPDPRHPRRHPRGAAHPPAQGLGEHAEGDAALHRGADRPRRPAPAPTGVKLLRADSGFWNTKVFERLEQAGWQYSIGVRMQQEDPRGGRGDRRGRLADDRLPRRGRGADRRDHLRRPAADRPPHPAGRRAGRAVARLAALRVHHQPHRGAHARRGRASRPRRRRAGDRRPQRPGAGALPLRRVQRQRRLDRARRARAQPAPLDTTARTPRHAPSAPPAPCAAGCSASPAA